MIKAAADVGREDKVRSLSGWSGLFPTARGGRDTLSLSPISGRFEEKTMLSFKRIDGSRDRAAGCCRPDPAEPEYEHRCDL